MDINEVNKIFSKIVYKEDSVTKSLEFEVAKDNKYTYKVIIKQSGYSLNFFTNNPSMKYQLGLNPFYNETTIKIVNQTTYEEINCSLEKTAQRLIDGVSFYECRFNELNQTAMKTDNSIEILEAEIKKNASKYEVEVKFSDKIPYNAKLEIYANAGSCEIVPANNNNHSFYMNSLTLNSSPPISVKKESTGRPEFNIEWPEVFTMAWRLNGERRETELYKPKSASNNNSFKYLPKAKQTAPDKPKQKTTPSDPPKNQTANTQTKVTENNTYGGESNRTRNVSNDNAAYIREIQLLKGQLDSKEKLLNAMTLQLDSLQKETESLRNELSTAREKLQKIEQLDKLLEEINPILTSSNINTIKAKLPYLKILSSIEQDYDSLNKVKSDPSAVFLRLFVWWARNEAIRNSLKDKPQYSKALFNDEMYEFHFKIAGLLESCQSESEFLDKLNEDIKNVLSGDELMDKLKNSINTIKELLKGETSDQGFRAIIEFLSSVIYLFKLLENEKAV